MGGSKQGRLLIDRGTNGLELNDSIIFAYAKPIFSVHLTFLYDIICNCKAFNKNIVSQNFYNKCKKKRD